MRLPRPGAARLSPAGRGASEPAVATALAAAGHAVAVHCRAASAAAEAVVSALPGAGHTMVTGDIADPEQAQALVGTAVTALGGIDVLVNNAGVYFEQPITSTSYAAWQDAWRRIVGINLHGTANVTWCVTDHLLHRAEGPAGAAIITVGSRGAYRGEPVRAGLWCEQGGGALAGTVARGRAGPARHHGGGRRTRLRRTDMTRGDARGPGRRRHQGAEPVRPGRSSPSEIAAAVAWLAAPGAQWASGAVLDLNGASHLR